MTNGVELQGMPYCHHHIVREIINQRPEYETRKLLLVKKTKLCI